VGPQVVALVLGSLVLATVAYGVARARALGRSYEARVRIAEHQARVALCLARAGHRDNRRVLESLSQTNDSLDFLAVLMHEQRSILNRFDGVGSSAASNDNEGASTSRLSSGVWPDPSRRPEESSG
jgi:hypothetical protein